MTATNNPFGLIPDYHAGGGTIRRTKVGSRTLGQNGILATDANVIYFGGLVKYQTNGVITRAATNDTVIAGVFAGCEYDDSSGRHQVKWWDAPSSATNIVAYIYRDPDIIYRIQADGAMAITTIGNEANITAPTTGSSNSGQSTATLGTGSLTSSSTGQLQVMEISDSLDNAIGDSYTVVKVKISESAFAAGYNGF